MSTQECPFSRFCVSEYCTLTHPSPFLDLLPPTPEDPRITTSPYRLRNWLRIKAVIPLIKTVSDLSIYLSSLLTSASFFSKGTLSVITLHAFENLTPEEVKSFEEEILPTITELVLGSENVLHPPPVIMNTNALQLLTRRQCASFLACGFLGLFSTTLRKNYRNHPDVTGFVSMFTSSDQVSLTRLRCFIGYFHVIHNNMKNQHFMRELVTFNRVDSPPFDVKRLLQAKIKFSGISVNDEMGIMDFPETTLKADFANKYLGGGVLRGGNVQEEIMFMECPEMICGLFINTVMDDFTTIRISGAIRYTQIVGYGGRIEFKKIFEEQVKQNIVALDALVFGRDKEAQFKSDSIQREMTKIYSAVHSAYEDNLSDFVTGKWGCGVFGGDVILKFLLQSVVCCYCKRKMTFTTFHDKKTFEEINEFLHKLEKDPPELGNFVEWIFWYINTKQEWRTVLKDETLPSGSKPFKASTNDQCIIA
ncbi:poly ADP-ribose glycohydrolase, putative [Entamoeba invadens IP1]|uniref:poly ADP-ribose glycohydrolase, putative n=1 Tax=Entamoeba invadens IP1 TaxID=370355 RepID=UPI0002C3D6C6|nr:poly ADP-ribose glycohydrolase, putative [Entamoeba invadens IP1]ELP90616.1 poly ADP-ribose glycohydrolase, putative [Entamoeba invadens IP1]|eukprot:XP_004257387.1 poly ADP-ribose glycohydrolase, putative [Entamoeba invadens IP1]